MMVWGTISASGTGDLMKTDGIMDKKVYPNILEKHLGAVLLGLDLFSKRIIAETSCSRKSLLEH